MGGTTIAMVVQVNRLDKPNEYQHNAHCQNSSFDQICTSITNISVIRQEKANEHLEYQGQEQHLHEHCNLDSSI